MFYTLTIKDIMAAVDEIVNKALGVSLLDMVVQIGATLILVIIVKIFLWDKISAFLEKRKELMESEFESAKQANSDAQALQEKTSQEYHDIKSKSKNMLEKAKQRGEEEREIIVGKAKEEAQSLMEQAEKEIAMEKKKAETEIRKEAVDLAALMASKIIEKEIDGEGYQDLITDKIEGSEKI